MRAHVGAYKGTKKRYFKLVQIVYQIEKKQWSDFDLAEKLSVLRTSGVIVFCLLLSSRSVQQWKKRPCIKESLIHSIYLASLTFGDTVVLDPKG